MTDWWQEPYPTNPDPPAVQQPRCVYPPDVDGGYEPSTDGPDVEAYKRAVSRLGRWEWANFDRDYSNRFAHGEPGDHVPETGIAGVQRQSGLDDTGNLGRKTFEVLRCALVPEELPHAGEPAFDGYAVELLNNTKWWKYPFAEGPGPPGVPKFPRTLWPPDDPSHPAMPPGPDVQAYKRAISRLGRWPWQTFDEDYSNNFAHGKSGNVGDTGVAGFQRQTPALDPTGNLTEKLYGHLVRALVPPCLPHANEYGLDGYAVELLQEAAANVPGGNVREAALDKAQSQLGYKESPAGSNNNKYGDWYGMNGVPWCAIFVSWCFETSGGSPSFAAGSYYSYVPYVVSDARNRRRGLSETFSPIPGDLVCYDWGWDGCFDHIGIYEEGSASAFSAIEGNTSTSNQSNGGQVMRRSRSAADADLCFVRVAE